MIDRLRRISPLTLGALLVGTEAVAALLDLYTAERGPFSPEELRNAQGGALFACGHLADWTALQYRPFCGGCTATSLLAAPLFTALGPTLAAWKIVPLAFHLLTTALLLALGHRLAGRRGLLLAGLLVLAAPEVWRDLAATGWGNHVESAAFTLGALLLATTPARRGASLGLSLGAGLLAGLGLWFCATSAHALPAILLGAALTHRRAAAGTLPALALGLLPWFWFRALHPVPANADALPLFTTTLAPTADQLRWWLTDFTEGALWRALPQGELDPIGLLAYLTLLVGGAAGLLHHRRHPLGKAGLLALAGLFTATVLRHDLWRDTPALHGFDAFNFRYRAPLLPLLWLGLAALPGRAGLAPAALLLAIGLPLRLSSWGAATPAWRSAPFAPLLPDPTVPSGAPAQRLDRLLHRPQDIEAAVAFTRGHADPLPYCRASHLGELGRRLGLALAHDGKPGALNGIAAAFPAPADQAAIADGIAAAAAQVAPERSGALHEAAEALRPAD